jgi:hypothetical protein
MTPQADSPCIPVDRLCLSAFTDLAAPLKARHTREKDMKNLALKEAEASTPEVDTGLLTGWLDRANLAREYPS